MNKRDEAIMNWVKKNRPDCVRTVRSILNMAYQGGSDQADAISALMFMAFEGGREFQKATGAELGNPNIYLS